MTLNKNYFYIYEANDMIYEYRECTLIHEYDDGCTLLILDLKTNLLKDIHVDNILCKVF